MVLEKERSPASEALIALRKAMTGKKGRPGMTQQDFAVHVLGTSIGTVARYETTEPPKGDVLLKLRSIAKQIRQEDIAETFQRLWLEEVFTLLGQDAKNMLITDPGANRSMLVASVSNGPPLRASHDFLTLVQHYESGKEPYRSAAMAIFKAMQEAASAGVEDPMAKQITDTFYGKHK